MNRIYKSLYSTALGTWIAVSELATGKSKSTVGWADEGSPSFTNTEDGLRFSAHPTLLTIALFTLSNNAFALPTGNELVAGQATVSTPNATQLQIDQTSQRAVINWQGFSVRQNEAVTIQQPNAQAALLNRVVGQDASQIQGKLQANGQVYLTNPNGIIFSNTAQVDVGGLVATTHDITNQDFMNSKNHFSQNGATGKVENHGTINSTEGGVVALIGESVTNTGSINTPKGTTALAAGKTVDLDIKGDGLVEVNVTEAALNAQIQNHGAITADGGRVVMTAKAANNLMDTVINQNGIVKARGMVERDGEIILDGGSNGTVTISGELNASNVGGAESSHPTNQIQITGKNIEINDTAKLNASGNTQGGRIQIGDKQNTEQVTLKQGAIVTTSVIEHGHAGHIDVLANMASGQVHVLGHLHADAEQQGNGGFIDTSAAKVKVADSATISTKAPQGKQGTWLIDPYDFTIGTDITGTALSAALTANSVTIQTTTVPASCISATCGSGSAGNGDIFVNDVVNWANNTLTLQAHRNIYLNSNLKATGTAGLVLEYGLGLPALDNPSLIKTQQGTAVSLASTGSFSTKLGSDGIAKTYKIITTLGVQASMTANDLQGMQGNLALNYVLGADIDATITNTWNSGEGFFPIGSATNSFSGSFEGLGHTINNLYIKRAANGVGLFGYTSSNTTISNVGLNNNNINARVNVGGLVGVNQGTIVNSYSKGTVSGTAITVGTGTGIGGLVGYNKGNIIGSYTTGTVTGTGGFADSFGGLVGFANGATAQIYDSYSTANVTAVGNNTNVGGLVGGIINGGLVSRSYASGNVNSTGNNFAWIGGLIGGIDVGGSVTDSYATGAVSSTGNNNSIGGLIGYSDANVSNTYATGKVSSSGTVNNVGGLIGTKTAPSSVNQSFWDSVSTGLSGSAGGTALNSTQIKQYSTYSSIWNISNTGGSSAIWRIYDGYTAPLLRYWLTPLSITMNSTNKTYDGLVAPFNASYSIASATSSGHLFNTSDPYAGAKNVGQYSIVNAPYSDQQGYDISLNSKVLTITPASLSVTPDPVQNIIYGTTPATFSPIITGFVNGENANTAGVIGTALFNTTGYNGDVGSYDVSYSRGLSSRNYVFIDNKNSLNELIVQPATLFVSVDSQTIPYGTIPSAFSARFLGFVNGDSASTANISGNPLFNIASFTGDAGSYDVQYLTGLSSKNYIFKDYASSTNELTVLPSDKKDIVRITSDNLPELEKILVIPVTQKPVFIFDPYLLDPQINPLQVATTFTLQQKTPPFKHTLDIENGGVKQPLKRHRVISLFLSCQAQ